MIDHTKATPELFAAIAKAQAEVENAAKGSKNPHFKSTYADLAEILNTVRPVFSTHGVGLVQAPSFDGALASVTTMLTHASGGVITSVASCAVGKGDAQSVGAATTYLRRYSLAAMCGIAQEDDDGNAVSLVLPRLSENERLDNDCYKQELSDATTVEGLINISKRIARAAMPDGLKANLRTLYSQRLAEIKGAE